jgi:two-component system, OmpR family, sensor histidine kinase CiaH
MNYFSLFTQARLKLTLYYILIFLTLSSVISGLFYYRTSQVLKAEYDRLEHRIQLELRGMMFPQGQRMMLRQIQAEDLDIAKQQIIFQLLRINGILLIVVAASGYILSGFTLAPIEASMKKQKRFVSDIAHEIKTPLTALKTSLEVNLMDKKLPSAIKTLLKENLEDVTHLDELTTSMLKLSKNTDEPISSTSIPVSQIVDQAVRMTKSQSQTKKIKVIVDPIPASAVISGDKAALTDVVKILLDNAVKYSPPSTIVTISTTLNQQTVTIKVKDEGNGINKIDIDQIFDRFYRVDPSRSKIKQPGYGLGLSIAKTIVEYHNGTISVSSKPKSGSTFTLTFPRLK